jgi:hypothetical protein
MDAAIGAPGGGGAARLAGNGGEPPFQRILRGTTARLRLPAEKAAAVVFQS